MTQKILVPIDDSSPARNALEYALENHPEDDIELLHVIELPNPHPMYNYTVYHNQLGEFADMYEEHAEALLSTSEDLAETYGTTVETEHTRGDPVDEITDYVDEHDIDSVIIGSHGRSGVRRFFLGSVAEKVVRRLHVPVTVVSAEED